MEGHIDPPMILVVGNINFDILLPLDRLPGPHEKLACEGALTGYGGSAANTAWWLARLGIPVVLAGAVGEDPLGLEHLSALAKGGVSVKGVDRVPGASGLAVVFSLGMEKRMVRAPGANLNVRFRPELLAGCALVYLSGADTRTAGRYAEAAAAEGIPVLCGWHGAGDRGVSGFADGFILNSDEVRILTGQEDPAEGIRALDASLAAVTLPAGGCLVARGVEVLEVPSPALDPVDRTGGGDAFAAGFLAGLLKGRDVAECGKWGNALAAKVIMEKGARPAITLEEFNLKIES